VSQTSQDPTQEPGDGSTHKIKYDRTYQENLDPMEQIYEKHSQHY
jgi:hypothetical protein